jgi:hypothetical protein
MVNLKANQRGHKWLLTIYQNKLKANPQAAVIS